MKRIVHMIGAGIVLCFGLLVFGIIVPRAQATTVYSLSLGNVGGLPGDYGTVTVDLSDPTHAGVTFRSALGVSGFDYYFMGEGAFGLNVNAAFFNASTPSLVGVGGFAAPSFVSWGSGNQDGWDFFNLTGKMFAGAGSPAREASFILTNLSGTWTTSAGVLAPNAKGYFVSAHEMQCDAPCSPADGAIVTFFTTDGGRETNIPEPQSLALLGAGLLGLGVYRRKRR